MRCRDPIEPVEFSRRICQDASTVGHGGAQARYLNRLTPVTVIVKATENGLEEGARQVLASHFKLIPKAPKAIADSEAAQGEGEAEEKEGGLDANKQPATVSNNEHAPAYPARATNRLVHSTRFGLRYVATALSKGMM